MSTTVCPKCGAKLDASARFCAGCGQAVSAPAGVTGPPPTTPGPAGGKKVPVLPVAIFGAGLVVLVGALTFMRSSAPPGGEAAPPVSPSAVPAPTSALSFPDTLPPAVPGSSSSPGASPDATVAGSRASSTKSWKDPLAPGGGSAAPSRKAPAGFGAAPPAPPPALPAPPNAPPVSRTYECRENASFNITPEEIFITVDGQGIGSVDKWDGSSERKRYAFRNPGVHYVKLSHEQYETVWIKVVVSSGAPKRTADVEIQMKRVRRKDN